MPASRATSRRRHAAIALLLGAAAWGGCSVEKHYELLSLFFDGVPDPNAVVDDGGSRGPRDRGGAGGPVTVASAHAGWAERRCTDCHVPQRRDTVFLSLGVGEPEQDVCMKCHAAVIDAPRFVHGPVAARFCLECHLPHESPLPHLLTEPAPALCLGCHALDTLMPIPEHGDAARSCLECHYGHGGDDRAFLRPAAPEPPAAENASDAGAG